MIKTLLSPDDVCECGDWRKRHAKDGKCRVCGDSKAPWDGCMQFRLAHTAKTDLDKRMKEKLAKI